MIFYFSGTGNSLWAAEEIASATGDTITDMAQALKSGKTGYRIGNGENIGFVFPIYFSGVPSVVLRFMEQVNITYDECYVFALSTCGASSAGSDVMFKKIAADNDIKINSFFELKMPDNYVVMYDPADEKSADDVITEAKSDILDIEERIMNHSEKGYNSGIKGKISNGIMYPFYDVFRNTAKFYAYDKCVSCGLCEKICPDSAIEIDDGKPMWVNNKCSHCTACINRCPQKAIQYGKGTVNRGRYANPILK